VGLFPAIRCELYSVVPDRLADVAVFLVWCVNFGTYLSLYGLSSRWDERENWHFPGVLFLVLCVLEGFTPRALFGSLKMRSKANSRCLPHPAVSGKLIYQLQCSTTLTLPRQCLYLFLNSVFDPGLHLVSPGLCVVESPPRLTSHTSTRSLPIRGCAPLSTYSRKVSSTTVHHRELEI
jgi:hypothetical protein